jgi:hypothetical protein
MPTILIINGIKICIYFNDHGKAHIHAIKDDSEAKILIETAKCISANGFSERDVRKLEKFVKKHATLLLEKWEELQ